MLLGDECIEIPDSDDDSIDVDAIIVKKPMPLKRIYKTPSGNVGFAKSVGTSVFDKGCEKITPGDIYSAGIDTPGDGDVRVNTSCIYTPGDFCIDTTGSCIDIATPGVETTCIDTSCVNTTII